MIPSIPLILQNLRLLEAYEYSGQGTTGKASETYLYTDAHLF
jgi:hypothetical protein